MYHNKPINRMIALLLAVILCVSCGAFAAGAADAADVIAPELLEKIAADPNAPIQIFVERRHTPLTVEDMPSYDSTDKDSLYTARKELAAINKERNQAFIDELAKYAYFTVDNNTNSTIIVLTMKGEDVVRLAECDDVFGIEALPDGQWINMSGDTADVCVVYGYAMTAAEQNRYNDADWTEKVSILTECYQRSKVDLLDGVESICDCQVIRDTSINRIFLRVPASAVVEIKKLDVVRSLSYYELSVSKLNDKAQELITEADPDRVVSVIVSTDRGDIDAMRDFFNVTKNEMNAYFQIEDENGVNEWLRACKAYYSNYHRQLIDRISSATCAVWQPYSSVTHGDETFTDLDDSCWTRFSVPVKQLEALSRIEGVSSVTYEPPTEPDPNDNWYSFGGDQDLLHKLLGEPNEYGYYYVPDGVSVAFGKADEEEYSRYKEIDYVKGVKYCRPAPADGWWKLEGNPSLLRATYGEPNADGRYYVPKKDAVKGDVDYDYDLTILDATVIQRELAELGCVHFNVSAADYDSDGFITILDATSIQRVLVD